MESKQVLSIEQMQHLQELGLKLKDAMIYWSKPHKGVICRCGNDWFLSFADDKTRMFFEVIPAYTLQDVLDALPDFIDEYCLIIDMSFGVIRYDNLKRKDSPILKETYFNNEDKCIIDAAYEMLCWCVVSGHAETDKNK